MTPPQEILDAGEMCPYDYQSEFDWGTYNQMVTWPVLGPAEGRSMIPLARRVGKREFGRLKK